MYHFVARKGRWLMLRRATLWTLATLGVVLIVLAFVSAVAAPLAGLGAALFVAGGWR